MTLSAVEMRTVNNARKKRQAQKTKRLFAHHKLVLEEYFADHSIPSIVAVIGLEEIKYLTWEDYTAVIEQLIMEPPRP